MNNRDKTIEAEIYFLICKFLSNGPCLKAAKAIKEEIEEFNLLPKRLKWTGSETNITYSEFEKNYPYIKNDFLLKICSRIGLILDQNLPPSVPGVASLLGTGTQSLLRSSSSKLTVCCKIFTFFKLMLFSHSSLDIKPQNLTQLLYTCLHKTFHHSPKSTPYLSSNIGMIIIIIIVIYYLHFLFFSVKNLLISS